jgi:hypothetical protein
LRFRKLQKLAELRQSLAGAVPPDHEDFIEKLLTATCEGGYGSPSEMSLSYCDQWVTRVPKEGVRCDRRRGSDDHRLLVEARGQERAIGKGIPNGKDSRCKLKGGSK